MREWLEAQLAAGLPAFSGSAMSGTLAVKQELLNELLAKWLQTQTLANSAQPFDTARLKTFVTSAAVRVEPGTVLVDFQVSI
jgi:hypothetical protein